MNKVISEFHENKNQHQKDFPTLFDFGDMTKSEESLVSGLLALVGKEMKLRGEYNPNDLIEIPYRDLAILASGKLVRTSIDKKTGEKYQYIATGKMLNELIEVIQQKLKSVRYDSYELFSECQINHKEQLLKVNLSDEIYRQEYIDEAGNLHEAKRVYELFFQENWSNVQYLYYNPAFHNALGSKYAMRIYRALATFRKGTFFRIKADSLIEDIMKLDTPSKRRASSKYITEGFDILQKARDQYDNPVFPDLKLIKEKQGRKIVRYTFEFKPFSNDMLPLIEVDDKGRFVFDFGYQKVDSETNASEDFLEVMDVFYAVFSKDISVDNLNNHRTIKKWLEQVDKDLVIEILNRTGYKAGRTFGWTVGAMNKIIAMGITTKDELIRIEDLAQLINFWN
ncbi:hypothetical protein [Streptococcus sp. zg-JUN1979]|uniref:hypothetical protein n=1 Tax=Streptococcus sp. zg-JUN1979 TaxID=3391450 RepID=UPI0039B04C20